MAEVSSSARIAGRPAGGLERGLVTAAPDRRRVLQLALGAAWLLDGLLQLQAAFFGRGFSGMIRSMAAGNPGLLAAPIRGSATIISEHPDLTNGLFAVLQIGIGLAIAARPTQRIGLASSVAWSLGVWWIGEGLGGVLNGAADPVNGAPGAVVLYALLAVLLWPSPRDADAPFEAARVVGPSAAKALWLVLWASLSYFAVAGSNRSAQALHHLVAAQQSGEPSWLAGLDRAAAAALDHRGLGVSIALAVVLAVVAVGIYLPGRAANAVLVLAVVVSLLFWVVGQDLGAILTGAATDLSSGPLLVLLALAYWPARSRERAAAACGDSR